MTFAIFWKQIFNWNLTKKRSMVINCFIALLLDCYVAELLSC